MRRFFIALLSIGLLVGCLLLGACATAQQGSSRSAEFGEASGQSQVETRHLIIDTDTAADDASALILAAYDPCVDIEGVTALAGNVDLDQAVRNALMALEVADFEAPAYRGSATALDGTVREAASVYGTDGMGDKGLVHPSGEAAEGDGVDFILETVRANPDEIEIVVLGPATNIARAIERDPEAMRHVKMIWSMGTAGLGPGNASPVVEFNVYKDAPAYEKMLESGIPVTIIGFDVCNGDALWNSAQFEELKVSGPVGEFVAESFAKIRDHYEKNGYDDAVNNCDALAMMCALHPEFVASSKRRHASCITDEGETYGQMVFYQEGYTYDAASNDLPINVTLVTEVDADGFFDRFKEAVSSK